MRVSVFAKLTHMCHMGSSHVGDRSMGSEFGLTMPSVVSPLSRARKALHSPNAKPNRQPSLSTRARMETKPVLTVRASTSMPPVQSKVPSMHNGSTSLLFEAGGSAIVIGVSCTLMGAAVDRSTGMAAGGFRATAALGFADEEGATLASARAGVGLALKDVGNTLPSMSSNVDQTNPLGGSGSTGELLLLLLLLHKHGWRA